MWTLDNFLWYFFISSISSTVNACIKSALNKYLLKKRGLAIIFFILSLFCANGLKPPWGVTKYFQPFFFIAFARKIEKISYTPWKLIISGLPKLLIMWSIQTFVFIIKLCFEPLYGFKYSILFGNDLFEIFNFFVDKTPTFISFKSANASARLIITLVGPSAPIWS